MNTKDRETGSSRISLSVNFQLVWFFRLVAYGYSIQESPAFKELVSQKQLDWLLMLRYTFSNRVCISHGIRNTFTFQTAINIFKKAFLKYAPLYKDLIV